MNILLCSLGGTWQVVPEVYGFTNPDALPLYARAPYASELAALRRRHGIAPVDAIWIVTTEGTGEAWQRLGEWRAALAGIAHQSTAAGAETLSGRGARRAPELRRWYPRGVAEIAGEAEDRAFAELAHRVVLHARARAERLYLCLAGGRKTMSAWLQQAAHRFGCDLLLHVLERFDRLEAASRAALRDATPRELAGALPPELAGGVRPLVVAAHLEAGDALRSLLAGARPAAAGDGPSGTEWAGSDFPLPPDGGACPPSTALVETVERSLAAAQSLLGNQALQLSKDEPGGTFRALYALPSRLIGTLREERIGRDPARAEQDRAWLARLPKAELHCHLGGVLTVPEMIEVAGALDAEVSDHAGRDRSFRRWREALAEAVREGDLAAVEALAGGGDLKTLRSAFEAPEPLAVAAFLLAFAGHAERLEALIYGELADPRRFCGVGIERYEALGDLQGSGLLQHQETLRATLRALARRCRRERVRYLELRCSPMNCTRGGLGAEQVVAVLLDEAERFAECEVRLSFIASRHGSLELAAEHVALAVRLLEDDARFRRRFAGFDLAGAEWARSPAELRELFAPLRERVVRTTIHAGEGERPENIWEAVYELAADRIGHGLTLGEASAELCTRFRDRRIALEMCPSSNYQIVGYRDHLLGSGPKDRHYPLANYLAEGLHVTVNTDNPGISRTTLGEEYLKAAAMSEQGLTRWEVLRIVRNAFRAAFCEHTARRELLLAAEREVMEAIAAEAGP